MNMPRGIRLRNPGNIDKSGTPWLGKVAGTDPRFETFDTMIHGVRALYMNLMHHIIHGEHTIPQLVSAWAPPNENNTQAYIDEVCRVTGYLVDQPIEPTFEMLGPIARAITIQENGHTPDGGEWIGPEIFRQAWEEVAPMATLIKKG